MKKWVKWIVRIVLGLFLLLIVLIIAIHTAPVKRLIRNKLQAYLSSKINTEVRIAAVNYRLPKWVEVDGVFLRDKAGDTLVYGDKLRVDINMLKLLKGEYQVNKVELGSVMVNISRKEKDSTFNYQFLIDAFAGKKTNEPEKKSAVSLSLDEIDITHSSFKLNDRYGGTVLATSVGNFHIKMDSINVNTLQFGINKWTIADMVFDMHLMNMHIPKKVDSAITSANSIPRVTLSGLTIARSHFGFDDEGLGISTDNQIDTMSLTGLVTSAPMKIRLDKLELKRSALSLSQSATQTSVADKVRSTKEQKDTVKGNLDIAVKQVSLLSNTLTYNDLSKKAAAKGFDPNRIALRSLTGEVSNISYGGKTTKALVKSLSGTDKSGFILDTLHGDIDMEDSVINLKYLVLKTPSSRINGNMQLYPESFADNYRGKQVNKISFTNNVISRKDIALLAPSVTDKYSKQLQGISFIYLNAEMLGNTSRMAIKNLTVHSDKNDVYLNAGGTLSNLRSKNNLQFDVSVARLTATKNFIEPFINTNGKQQVNMPPLINVTGKVRGNMKELNNDLVVTSSYGSASIKGQIRNYTTPNKLNYNLRLIAKNLETGKWINRDSLLGKLNGSVMIKGSGIDYKTADISSVIDISSFGLKQHLYTGIQFNINGTHGAYDIKGKIADSLIRLNMNVHTTFDKQYPTATGKVNIQNVDLYTLGLYKTPLSIQTKMDLQVKDLSPENLDALVRLDSTTVYMDKKVIRTDSLIAKGIRDSGKTLLMLRSSMADATIKGDYKYTELGDVMQGVLARYSKSQTAKPAPSTASFNMAIDLKPDPVYALLLPGLFFDKNIHATGKIDTKQKDSTLVFYLAAPSFTYGSNHLSNLVARANGVNDSIKYSIVLDTVRSSSLLLYTTSVAGGFSNNHLTANLVTNDDKKKPKYALGVAGSIDNDVYTIQLADKLKINYADWVVDKQNKITYSKQGVNISNFKITKNAESVAVNSTTGTPNAPIDVKIDRFSLANITGLLNRDSLEIAGVLNAQVKVDGLDKAVPLFNGKIKIDSLAYQAKPVGNFELNAQNTAESVTFDGALTGRGNNVTLKGNYNQSAIDATINLSPIQFASIEPFTQHNLARSSGTVTGNIAITGDVKSPQWNGSIRFDSAYTQLAQYGTVLKISGQSIDLKYPVITFNQFTIKDSLDHRFVINGTLTQENGSFKTDLTAKTKNFTALDNSPVANAQIYGKAIVDVDVTIAGTATAPDITGNIGLKEKSVVTFVRQEHIASAKDREGVMEFVNIDTINNKLTGFTDTAAVDHSQVMALNYNLNIDINKDAQFNVIIDPITRDELQVQGGGQLNAGLNPNGDISITGAYNLSKGSYQLNNKFLKRRFILQEGSTIVLSGDPKNAEADITAIYDINASPFDLVANEVSDYSNNDDNLYKQKLPFQVILKIKGKVMEPKLEFDVQRKEGVAGINSDMGNTIDNKLQQMRSDPSTMNKQVFALLVMGRFIGEQSKDFFAGSNGDGIKADQIVKESVSRFLSDAVSQVASDLIKGVDVDVNLKTVDDYSTATERTDLNLALSKRFLNDRLNITVGKSFTVDGEDPLAKGQDNSNLQFLPDITTSYKLSKDGRYMLKAYQKNEYEAILDGYFIETGVAFTVTVDYNKFKEIFDKLKKKKKRGTKKTANTVTNTTLNEKKEK